MTALRISGSALAPLGLLVLGAGDPAGGADQKTPGAYCPLPKRGEVAQCLVPARSEYREFFGALERGELADREAARVEADVRAGSDHAYLALSSLAYGYYRLAQRAAATPGEDPLVVARLERWNGLLSRAYTASPEARGFREAVRAAALDLRAHSPPAGLGCVDAEGHPARCESTEAVLRAIEEADRAIGVRGPLGRLLQRLLGGDPG